MAVLTTAPSPLLKVSASAARCLLWLLLSAWLVLAVGWGALHWVIVPRIDEFRPQLEARVSKVLGVTVRMGGITAQSTGLIPSFALSDVRLVDAQGRAALTLPRVLVSLSPRSVLGLGFEQLSIDRPELDVRRAADGRVFVAGLDMTGAEPGDTRALDWFFSQPELAIRHGTVMWTDELRGAPPLALSDVDLVVRNRSRNHSLRVDATPPADWGSRVGLMAVLRQPLWARGNGRWQEWEGQLFAAADHVDLSQLRLYADLGGQVARGSGALRAWADVSRGAVVSVTADVVMTDVTAVLRSDLQPLRLRSMAGRLGGRLDASGFEFSTQGLQFDTQDGMHWPGGNVQVRYSTGQPGGKAHGELSADRLDLAALSQIANRLPVTESLRTGLATYTPKGLVERVSAKWQGPLEAPTQLEAQGRVSQLALAAESLAGIPGIRGATLDFDLTRAGGKASLSIDNGAVLLPGVFEETVLPLTQASTTLNWQLDGEKIAIQLTNAKFSNADAQGELNAKWHTSDPATSSSKSRFPGTLDLQAVLHKGEGTRVHRYLPMVLHKAVRDYVRDAVVQGSASNIRFLVKGDLHDMPFADPRLGEFRISADVHDAQFAFVPRSLQPRDALPWPVLTQLSGELVIDRTTLQIKGGRGNLAGLQVSKAEAQIGDLQKNSVVVVNAEARGQLPDMLALVNGSPLAGLTEQVLSQASGTGPADVRLKLSLPIANTDKATVQGGVLLAGNDLQFSADTPRISRARGTVNFTESGFGLTNMQARLLGGDARVEGGSQPVPPGSSAATRLTPSVLLRAQGTVTAEGLRQARELGFVARLAQHATGSASYAAVLGFRRGHPELLVTSSLTGLGLTLPAPFGKTADTAMPLRLETALVRESLQPGPGGQSRLQEQLRLELGRVASASYVRDVSSAEARVLRGSLAVGLAADEVAPLPEEGVLANINMNRIDTDAWTEVLSQTTGASLSVVESGTGGPTRASTASQALGYLPTVLAVRTRELQVGSRRFGNVVVGGSRDGSTWRANVDAQELNGYVEYRQPVGANAGRVYARLARLTLAPSSASEVESFLDEQPASIPALDVVVDDLELRGKRLGRAELEAVNRVPTGPGGVREWRLSKFNMSMPEATFTATGNWVALNAQTTPPGAVRSGAGRSPVDRRRTVMNFKLDINDAGELLGRLGMKDVIRRGKGRLEGQVAWVGSPLSFDYPSMGGAFNLNVDAGQFLKADPGLAKLLSVLSLQSLPRRLALDFRDVFSEGFAFDFIRGDVTIDAGMATTNNLQMKGVNAAVLMDGRADIARETQDLRVVVVPEINAGTASLIASAINPAIGLGTFLAQYVLRRPLMEAATQEFHIDGTWMDPKIVKVERKAGADMGAPAKAAVP